MPHTTVCYHAGCPDGTAAMFACWQQFGEEAQYLPVFYGQPFPAIPDDHTVMIVDFSYPPDVLLGVLASRRTIENERYPSVIVLDHHASAQRDLVALARQQLSGLGICFDLAESGASLTWKWFCTRGQLPDPTHQPDAWAAVEDAMPTFYKYVRDRDLWQWKLPDSKAVSLAYWILDKDPLSIEQFAQDLDDAEGYHKIVTQGAAMQLYADSLVREQAARAIPMTLAGHQVPVVNATTLFSEVGDYLCRLDENIPFAAYYFDRQDQRQWGLRSRGDFGCSVVAKQFGGGGHAGAAGFVTAKGWLPQEDSAHA